MGSLTKRKGRASGRRSRHVHAAGTKPPDSGPETAPRLKNDFHTLFHHIRPEATLRTSPAAETR